MKNLIGFLALKLFIAVPGIAQQRQPDEHSQQGRPAEQARPAEPQLPASQGRYIPEHALFPNRNISNARLNRNTKPNRNAEPSRNGRRCSKSIRPIAISQDIPTLPTSTIMTAHGSATSRGAMMLTIISIIPGRTDVSRLALAAITSGDCRAETANAFGSAATISVLRLGTTSSVMTGYGTAMRS